MLVEKACSNKREMQGTYPVIFLSFANIKATDYYKMTKVIADLYTQNRFLLEENLLSENEKVYFNSIKPGMPGEAASDAIHSMADFMCRYYGKNVIILFDEYDTPVQEA